MRDPRRRPVRRPISLESSARKTSPSPEKKSVATPSSAVSKSSPSPVRPREPKKSGIGGAAIVFIILSIALLGTSLFLYKQRVNIENKLTAEKEALFKDFQEIKEKFDIISARNTELTDSLSMSTVQITQYMDSLRKTRLSIRALRRYRSKFLAIRKDNQMVLKINDSLINMVGALTEERNSLVFQLKEQIEINDSLMKTNNLLQKQFKDSGNVDSDGNVVVSASSLLTLDRFLASGQITDKKGKTRPEKKIKKSTKMKICFTALANDLSESGEYTFYIKVVDPKGKVLGLNKTYSKRNVKVPYSLQSKFFYDKENGTDICEFLPKGKGFKTGSYSIVIYDSNINIVGQYNPKLK